MKKRIFTLMMAFLAVASGAVWGQSSITINGTSVTGDGSGWKYDQASNNNVLTISTPGSYSISAAGDGDNNNNIQIVISKAGEYTISLNNVRTDAQLGDDLNGNADAEKYSKHCAFQIGGDNRENVVVTLNWTGANKFWSSPERAGINVKPGATLILNDADNNGTLEAGSLCNGGNGHTYGAGIGGDQIEPNFGTIIIENGNINARCESKGNRASKLLDAYGAGIGGGYSDSKVSTEGTIIIKGGTIETASWSVDNGSNYSDDKLGNKYSYGAGIGGGWQGTCTNIAILGGNVTANSYRGDDIGVGYQYSNGVTDGIVIGQWDEDSAEPTINNNPKINNTNLVKDGTLSGNVTMPEGTQVYIETLVPSGQDQDDRFYAYNLNLTNSIITDEENESHNLTTGADELKKAGYYYFGANMQFAMSQLACSMEHLFMGWISTDGNRIVAATNSDDIIFKMPSDAPEGPNDAQNFGVEKLYYKAVWVDNEYTIVVPSGRQWTEDSKNTPYIYTAGIGEGQWNNLKFAFSDDGKAESYTSSSSGLFMNGNTLTFSDNKLIGTPTLPEGKNYLEEKEIKAYVQLGENGSWKELTIKIRCAEQIVINSISVSSGSHTYDGLPHNGLEEYRGDDKDHLLTVTMADWGDSGIEASDLKEGVHYRISSFDYKAFGSEESTHVSAEEGSALITDAGAYSNVVIEALDGVTFSSSFATDRNSYTITGPITVAARPMAITLSVESITEDEELTWDDVTIDIQEQKGTEGLVTSENIDVSGTVNYEMNDEGTLATVTITNIKIAAAEGSLFKASNYNVTMNAKSYTDNLELTIPDVPVNPSSTGGGTTDKRYQLYLANKDYLKTDEKTVEYYEDLKLELFSRHNKKYTDAGGSFTIWYEKDGEANVGGYRLFWSKSGEHGDYQEVKFDPVSEYFRIDNVHSDVYVKIYDADGFPVANEAITAQDFRAYAQPNKIIVITPEPTDVQIISMAGTVVAADKVTGQREFANLAEGVYIVRMGETIVKLQVRN